MVRVKNLIIKYTEKKTPESVIHGNTESGHLQKNAEEIRLLIIVIIITNKLSGHATIKIYTKYNEKRSHKTNYKI